jgi:hypothetical protein
VTDFIASLHAGIENSSISHSRTCINSESFSCGLIVPTARDSVKICELGSFIYNPLFTKPTRRPFNYWCGT